RALQPALHDRREERHARVHARRGQRDAAVPDPPRGDGELSVSSRRATRAEDARRERPRGSVRWLRAALLALLLLGGTLAYVTQPLLPGERVPPSLRADPE